MGGCCSKSPVEPPQPAQARKTEVNGRVKEDVSTRAANGGREPAVKKPEAPKKPTMERKQSTITAANLKNNQSHSQPLGKRTNFGYEGDFKEKYMLVTLLGRGQFGYTYVATEKATGLKVAAKCIEKKQMTHPISVEDVKREVKILQSTLSGHENVVQFYAAFEVDDLVYIVMELCEGGKLLDRILAKKDSRYSEKDAAKIVRQMLNAAGQCHLNKVVHRDLKPENFLFKSTKEDSPLKATDFGLSDYIKPGKQFHDVMGTSYYIAPEVLNGRSGPESDVWSIGAITYILLCGRRPFWDKTEDGIFNEVLKKKPDFREKPWPSISESAQDFVKKLLVKDPQMRPTAAQPLSHPWVEKGEDTWHRPASPASGICNTQEEDGEMSD